MQRLGTVFIAAFFLTAGRVAAQDKDSLLLTGTWKGTSLCEEKNGPCHDENVVYHISKLPGSRAYRIQANKIVNGVEEDMGIIDCTWNDSLKKLTATTTDRSNRTAVWSFDVHDKRMSGTLVLNGTTLFRRIEVKR